MEKGDDVGEIRLVVRQEKYALVGQVHQVFGAGNADFVDGRVAVIRKPAQYEYE
ncbi:hypothetical protein D3C87_2070170 [compost metagenome]